MSASKSSMRLPISSCSRIFLLQFLTKRKKVMLAMVSTTPTTIVFTYNEIPKRSRVNCVRQQNICIMNMRMEPPIIDKICLGSRIYLIDLSLSISLFSMNSCVYSVSMMAPRAQAREQAIRPQKNMLVSSKTRNKTPKVISLSAHPTSTFTVFSSALLGQFQLMKTKVRLLRGPMLKLARMKPAVRSTSKITELTNSRQELTTNSHRRPMMSERMPAEKLPREQARKVQRVRVSRSPISRKITLSTNSPESQNSAMSSQTKASPFPTIQLHEQIQQQKLLSFEYQLQAVQLISFTYSSYSYFQQSYYNIKGRH